MSEPTASLDRVDLATSPGLRAGAKAGPAFELKFELALDAAQSMKAWARRHLRPDPHGVDGSYQVASVYCDTPDFDVFHRSAGYRRSKLRLRRYGSAPVVFLERKLKKGDQVRKRRVQVVPEELARLAACVSGAVPPEGWPAGWFLDQAVKKNVAPACRVGYRRTAFYGADGIRLTIDESLRGAPVRGWEAPAVHDGLELLPGAALLELKFMGVLPDLFRGLLPGLPSRLAGVSKYRRCVRVCGLVPERVAAVVEGA